MARRPARGPTPRTRPLTAAPLIAAAALLLSACGTGAPASAKDASLTVFAAASLRTVLDQVGADFEAEHPGTEVTVSYAGSSDLVAQLEAGAPADVLVTANRSTMDRAVEAGNVAGDPVVVATNVLTLVTGADNPLGIAGLEDAASAEVDLVVCAEQVPCGAAARTVADSAGVTLSPVSEENSVTDVLGKVTSGQADAGIVYATDAADAGDDVVPIALPGAEDARTEYPAAVAAETPAPELAQEFVAFLSAEGAQQHLADAGFGTP